MGAWLTPLRTQKGRCWAGSPHPCPVKGQCAVGSLLQVCTGPCPSCPKRDLWDVLRAVAQQSHPSRHDSSELAYFPLGSSAALLPAAPAAPGGASAKPRAAVTPPGPVQLPALPLGCFLANPSALVVVSILCRMGRFQGGCCTRQGRSCSLYLATAPLRCAKTGKGLCGRRTLQLAHQSISPSPDLAGGQSISPRCPLPTRSTCVMLAGGTGLQPV